jgi:hypothetical protein
LNSIRGQAETTICPFKKKAKDKMKFKELTDDQAFEIGKLALQSIVNFDLVFSVMKGQSNTDYSLYIKRELYDEKQNLQVVRVYIDGMPNCYCAIWEEDLNVDTYQDDEVVETANQVKIFKYMQSIGLIWNTI